MSGWRCKVAYRGQYFYNGLFPAPQGPADSGFGLTSRSRERRWTELWLPLSSLHILNV
uniref:Uncharacterized protein n=1 Tax=Anguilla anguilla TaxID=7936 RepID=A0A0E9WQL8_ANGAN